MDRWQGRVAVITGASAGIGAAVCLTLARHGVKVVGCARRVEKIEALKTESSNIYPYKCDMESEDEIQKMFEWIEQHPDLGRVDICLANAGLSTAETLLNGNYQNWKRMMDVNVLALCLCTQLALKSMLKHGVDDGQIILLNSLSGHRVPPNPSTRFYAASKFAVTALLEGWRQEIRDQGNNHIRIASISPGLVDTEFVPSMYKDNPAKVETIIGAQETIHAQDIADQVQFILASPKNVQIHDILVRPTEQKF